MVLLLLFFSYMIDSIGLLVRNHTLIMVYEQVLIDLFLISANYTYFDDLFITAVDHFH